MISQMLEQIRKEAKESIKTAEDFLCAPITHNKALVDEAHYMPVTEKRTLRLISALEACIEQRDGINDRSFETWMNTDGYNVELEKILRGSK